MKPKGSADRSDDDLWGTRPEPSLLLPIESTEEQVERTLTKKAPYMPKRVKSWTGSGHEGLAHYAIEILGSPVETGRKL
jgi:hypothetical protein